MRGSGAAPSAPTDRVRCWLVLLAATTAACGGTDDDAASPLVDMVAPALAAVEAARGGPQRYFEVNATPQLVNVFVAVDDATATVPYVYLDGELGPAAPSRPAEGATFSADAVAFDPATVLDQVIEDLPDSDIAVFSVVGGPGGAVQYGAVVRSAEGGTLDITVDADGDVLSVEPG